MLQLLFFFMQLKWTPLYAAAEGGHMKIVQYLIEERGCDFKVVTAVSWQISNISTALTLCTHTHTYVLTFFLLHMGISHLV